MTVTVKHLGCPGHLIVANNCRWRRHTQVDGPGGSWRISTLGEYYPHGGKRTTLGAGESSFFETMVFPTAINGVMPGSDGCGCRPVLDWADSDGERYATAGDAQAGHERFVAKYKLAAKKAKETLK